jgi:hypothetical protein
MKAPISRNRQSIIGAIFILLTATLAVAPQLIRGTSCGHDFDFHLVSWLDALDSWRHGVFYPHWTPSPNYGAGEPRFIFYPPLTWMLGAVLGAILPWSAVPITLTFLLLAATGFATRALARYALSDSAATLAGCITIFSGYTLYTAYERSAFAELSGGFWIPLALLLVLHERPSAQPQFLWRRTFDGSAGPLALVVAGSWLSNAPLGVMTCYLLAGFALAVALLTRSWAPFIRAVVASALGIGLTAVYLVPAAVEQRWVDIRQATDDPGLLIQNSWLFAHHADPQLKLHDVELFKVSIIAVLMIGLAIAAVLIAWLRGTLPGKRRFWLPLALIPLAVLFLQFPASFPVWNALPKLHFLQFPWRWLVVLEAPLGILLAAAIWPASRPRKAAIVATCTIAFIAATILAGRFYFESCYPEDAIPSMLASFSNGDGFEGTDEYEPPGADDSIVPLRLPGACLVTDPTAILGAGDPDSTPEWSPDQHTCQAVFPLIKPAADHLRVQAATSHPGYLILRLRSYPAWQVRVNGQPLSLIRRDDGLMAVPVPSGPVDVTIDWTTPTDVLIGRVISFLALILLACLSFIERRAAQPRLS